MICRYCKESGRTSRLYIGTAYRTAMGVTHYYDEQGHLHQDDPNVTSTDYHCSNGHQFQVRRSQDTAPAYTRFKDVAPQAPVSELDITAGGGTTTSVVPCRERDLAPPRGIDRFEEELREQNRREEQ